MGLVGTKGAPGVWQNIISEMPEHDVYIEPFWGRGTIAKKKRPAKHTIGIDMDPDAISDGAGHATMFLADGVQWLADYFRLPLTTDIAPGDLPAPAVDAVAPVTRSSDAAGSATTFGGTAVPRHFVYLDPPYLGFSGYYKHDLSRERHRILCRLFRRLPCPAALSGYHSEVLDAELRGCRRIEIPTVNRAGKRVIEVLWMNYPTPSRYHDVRFVGTTRRQRERIHRRVKTWSTALSKMGARERQAVFEACKKTYEQSTE